jgi:aquaporin NIP
LNESLSKPAPEPTANEQRLNLSDVACLFKGVKMKMYLAELFGTFTLVFAGTGAIIINDVTGGSVSHVGISLTFGLVVMAMIYSLGDISGAHLNPAVTFGFWISGRFSGRLLLPYILSQCLGAFLASAVLRFLFSQHSTLGATLPAGSISQAFVLEVILAFFLMFVIINVSVGAKETGLMAGVAIGAVVGLEAMFAGPITGASMNPARSLAPAVLSGQVHELWIYLVAPFLGAYLGIWGCRCVQEKGCCNKLQGQSQ